MHNAMVESLHGTLASSSLVSAAEEKHGLGQVGAAATTDLETCTTLQCATMLEFPNGSTVHTITLIKLTKIQHGGVVPAVMPKQQHHRKHMPARQEWLLLSPCRCCVQSTTAEASRAYIGSVPSYSAILIWLRQKVAICRKKRYLLMYQHHLPCPALDYHKSCYTAPLYCSLLSGTYSRVT